MATLVPSIQRSGRISSAIPTSRIEDSQIFRTLALAGSPESPLSNENASELVTKSCHLDLSQTPSKRLLRFSFPDFVIAVFHFESSM